MYVDSKRVGLIIGEVSEVIEETPASAVHAILLIDDNLVEIATMHFFCKLVIAVTLLFPLQQDVTPPAPSVADAARAAREHKESSKPKHVWTDDDISPKAGYAAAGIKESELRAQLDRYETVPRVPTVENLTLAIRSLTFLAKKDVGSDRYRQALLDGPDRTVFPDKKEWEQQMNTAVDHLMEEAGTAATRLQAILDENKNALSGGDPAAAQRVREDWVETLVPEAAWQMRIHHLMLDAEERVRANSSKPQPN